MHGLVDIYFMVLHVVKPDNGGTLFCNVLVSQSDLKVIALSRTIFIMINDRPKSRQPVVNP